MDYIVKYSNGKPDWSSIPAVALENHQWTEKTAIYPTAQVAWDENHFYVRLEAVEQDILARYTGLCDPICTDSCLEFFFCPEQDSDRYFNFELNPNGAMYVGFGYPGARRCRLYRENFAELFQVVPFSKPNGWGVELTIPFDFLRIFVPDFEVKKGSVLRGNFYKCGDETVKPHYISWNKVEVPTPSFHPPGFFAPLILD